jgi:hypothetical protein
MSLTNASKQTTILIAVSAAFAAALAYHLITRTSKDVCAYSAGVSVQTSELISIAGIGVYGDTKYAVVKASSIPEMYQLFQKEIFDKGVVKWDDRFDCNHFASYFVSLAQVKYYLDNWNSSTPAQTLAMGVIWYRLDGRVTYHAVVVVYTDAGLKYLEPQTGKLVTLSKTEELSAILRAF